MSCIVRTDKDQQGPNRNRSSDLKEKLPPAASVIAKECDFQQGTCYRDWLGNPCGPGQEPESFDCLGAILWAYRLTEVENRHLAAKRAFDLCEARYGHRRLGKLTWEHSLELLTDAWT